MWLWLKGRLYSPSMKVPPKRKGNSLLALAIGRKMGLPSMKVPPKRKGNPKT